MTSSVSADVKAASLISERGQAPAASALEGEGSAESKALQDENGKLRRRLKSKTRQAIIAACVPGIMGIVALFVVQQFNNEKIILAEQKKTAEKQAEDAKREKDKIQETQDSDKGEIKELRVALEAERERGRIKDNETARLRENNGSLKRSLARVYQVLNAPDESFTAARQSLTDAQLHRRQFRQSAGFADWLLGNDSSWLAEIATAPLEQNAAQGFVSAALRLYERRIEKASVTVKEALADELFLLPTYRDEGPPRPSDSETEKSERKSSQVLKDVKPQRRVKR
jgi:hypothetical protein